MIVVKDLKKNYNGLDVLKGIDLTINKGDVVCLVGPSGCGKSTFLRCLTRLEEPDGGTVMLDGKEITERDIDATRAQMGMVFQHFNLFPHLTVKKNITLAPVRLGRMSQAAADKQAMELLELDFSRDEDVVCITENDACGVDAIQVLLGCSVGKGNLLFHLRGKQAFSFYNRKTGKAVRLVLRPTPAEYQTKEERFRYLQDAAPASLFDVKPAVLSLPEKARLFQSLPCDGCGEVTAEHLLRLENGKKLCLDCFRAYNRFDV